HKNLHLKFRLQYFDTDDYNSRAYALEFGQLSGFSTSAFYGNGLSFFFSSKCRLRKKITAEFIMSESIYYGKALIGSGLDAINGNKKRTISFMLSKVF